ncbi:hypothetical protein FOL47_006826 [Perkinsus chesapeaki]|uniref:CS domain-containing protein n=1 Tax=Perkinsus chesapeaki TaxID=330153 RepID=A0A7J6MX57_PERCH|nr:hypothetical protein FOL47_006826 [Perkinsus chesapeaki]
MGSSGPSTHRFMGFVLLTAVLVFSLIRLGRANEKPAVLRIEEAVNASDWTLASELLRQEVIAGRGSEVDLRIRQLSANLHHQADHLVRLLDRDYAMGHYATVTPAIQWAQNSTHVFMNIKFSHRWNSPGALRVRDPQLSVSPCCFNFSATGELSGVVKRYILSFELAHDVVPYLEDDQTQKRMSASALLLVLTSDLPLRILAPRGWWTQSSVGRMTVTLKKNAPKKWRQLVAGGHNDKQPAVGYVGRWLDLEERYASELAGVAYDDSTEHALVSSTAEKRPRHKDSKLVELARYVRGRLMPKPLRALMPKSADAPRTVIAIAFSFWLGISAVALMVARIGFKPNGVADSCKDTKQE